MTSPSGEQIEIRLGAQDAVVVEVGAGLRSYSAGGRDVVDGYGADEMCSSGRGQVLIPWPNRLEDGTYELGGRRHRLPLTEPENGNAIHGLVRWAAWSVAEREPHRVVLEHVLRPQPGYPFSLALAIEYALSEEGLPCARRRRTSAPMRVRTAAELIPISGSRRDGGRGRASHARKVRVALGRPRDTGRHGVRRRGGARLPGCPTDRRGEAGPLLHGPRAGRGRSRARRAPQRGGCLLDAVGRRGASLLDAVHG